MAALFRNRPGLLIVPVLAGLALLELLGAGRAGAAFLDAVLAEVDGRTVTASDAGIARAFSLCGLRPSSAPIAPSEVDRMIDGLLIDQEAARLALGDVEDETEEIWRAAAARIGGMSAVARWLDRAGLDPVWARAMARREARTRRFLEVRFRPFVFVTEEDLAAALGPGAHAAEARGQARDALREAAVLRELAAWVAEARQRATIRYAGEHSGGVPLPFPMPPQPGREAR